MSRDAYRRRFAAEFAEGFADHPAGFAAVNGNTLRSWEWARDVGNGIRAAVVIRDLSGRHTRGGLDLRADGMITIDSAEVRLRQLTERSASAATLFAPLRSWGPTFTRDGVYRLRWATTPDSQIARMIQDFQAFASFAATVTSVSELSAHRLARSRIRRHVAQGLAPNYCTPLTAGVIEDLITAAGTDMTGSTG